MPYSSKDIAKYNRSLKDLRKVARSTYAEQAAKEIDKKIEQLMSLGDRIT